MATKKEEGLKLTLNPIKWRVATFEIQGTDGTPLAMQCRPSSVIDNLSRKDNGLPTIKYPSSDVRKFIDSMHWISNNKPDVLDETKTDQELWDELETLLKNKEARFGIPSEAFKESIVKGAKRAKITTDLVTLRGVLVVLGETCPIEFDTVEMEKVPTVNKNAMGNPMVISVYSKFINWKTSVKIKYNSALISAAELANIINAAGASVGILARRPELSFGKYGAYEVTKIRENDVE